VNEPQAQEVAERVTAEARDCMKEGLQKIEHCVGQLSDEQVWWRPRPDMNSIANLMLHLTGNVRQWIISGIGGAKDVRNRPGEFADQSRRSKAELLATLNSTVNEADAVLSKLTATQLVTPKRIQGFDTSVMGAIFSCVPHFRGHVQEIIHMTREQLAEKYRFEFVPQGPEQESKH
jgi:hypothetical protein